MAVNSNVCLHFFTIAMTTGAFSQNVGKLFSKLKVVTDNFFIYAEADWETTESFIFMNATEVAPRI